MTSLAAVQYNLARTNIVGWLKNHPDRIKTLSGLTQSATMLSTLPITILPSQTALLTAAATIGQAHGLLTADSMIVALMQQHGITHLATNDDDFDRVSGITVWKPRP